LLSGVVPAAGDGAPDLQRASRGEGEVVLLGQARRFRLPVAGRLLRPPAPYRGGGCWCGGGHRGGHRSGGQDLAASHGSPSTSSSGLHGSGLPLLVQAPCPPPRADGEPGGSASVRAAELLPLASSQHIAQPFTEPSMIPETKYRCTNGYTHRMGIRIRIIVTDWMLALMSLTAEPEAAAPSDAAVEAPAIRFLRNSVTGNRSVRSR